MLEREKSFVVWGIVIFIAIICGVLILGSIFSEPKLVMIDRQQAKQGREKKREELEERKERLHAQHALQIYDNFLFAMKNKGYVLRVELDGNSYWRANITVSDQWLWESRAWRRMTCQWLEKYWGRCLRRDSYCISILDVNGNALGGSNVFSGVWIRDD